MTLEEQFEQLMKDNAKKDAQFDYLRRKIEQAMRNNWREVHSSHSTSESNLVKDGFEDNPFASSEDDRGRTLRRASRGKQPALDFKVEIPEFEGQLYLDQFIDRMNIVKRVFEYKDVSDDKKIKLVALKLYQHASI